MNADLGVHDSPVVTFEPEVLGGSERGHVELDRLGGSVDHDVRDDGHVEIAAWFRQGTSFPLAVGGLFVEGVLERTTKRGRKSWVRMD